MSIAWTPKKPDRPPRGGAAVGMMDELPPTERYAILAFRLWCDGADGRETVASDFSRAFTPGRAAQEVNTFADLINIMLKGARRPIMRHGTSCLCFGGDEAVFAHMIAAATVGDNEDALAFALVLMKPSVAWQAVQLAREIGLSLRDLCRTTPTYH